MHESLFNVGFYVYGIYDHPLVKILALYMTPTVSAPFALGVAPRSCNYVSQHAPNTVTQAIVNITYMVINCS